MLFLGQVGAAVLIVLLSLCLATGSGADYCLFKSPSSWTVIWRASPLLLRPLSRVLRVLSRHQQQQETNKTKTGSPHGVLILHQPWLGLGEVLGGLGGNN